MHVGRGEEVAAARHQRHILDRVVDGDRQVIARGRVLARKHHVTVTHWIGGDPACFGILPLQRTRAHDGLRHVDAQRVTLAGGDALPALRLGAGAAGAGIERTFAAVRRGASAGDLPLDVAPGAETGIDQAHSAQAIERASVVLEMLGLPPHRAVPVEAEPGEILEDRVGEFGPAAALVDVLDTQQETSARAARANSRDEGGIRVT